MAQDLSIERAAVAKPVTPRWLWSARVLLLVAIAGAGFLAWVAFQHGPVAGCGAESGCDKVLHSPWAYWLDIPVSLPALLVYFSLFTATVILPRSATPDDERGSWAAIIALSMVVAGAALWFVGLQVFVIKAYCKFCMATHACGFGAALLCLWRIPMADDPTTPMWTAGSGKRGVPSSAVSLLLMLGLLGASVLILGQVLMPKKLNAIIDFRTHPNRPLAANTVASSERTLTNALVRAAAQSGQILRPASPDLRIIAPRQVGLYSNSFVLKLDAVPMMGVPDSANIIVVLFDYTCPHCRSLHPILAETQRQFSNQLGIVCLPMPISTNCNPLLPARVHSVSNACEFARLGLAVWRARPTAFRQFDDWMFASEQPPPLDQANAQAVRLVGAENLRDALGSPWLDEQLMANYHLHSTNWNSGGSAALPQLVMGNIISSGPLNSVEHLMILLNRYLGLTPPPGNSF